MYVCSFGRDGSRSTLGLQQKRRLASWGGDGQRASEWLGTGWSLSAVQPAASAQFKKARSVLTRRTGARSAVQRRSCPHDVVWAGVVGLPPWCCGAELQPSRNAKPAGLLRNAPPPYFVHGKASQRKQTPCPPSTRAVKAACEVGTLPICVSQHPPCSSY